MFGALLIVAALALCILAPVLLPMTIALRRGAGRLALATTLIAAIVMLSLFVVLDRVGGYPNFAWWILYPLAAGGLTIALTRIVVLNTKRHP